MDGIHDWSLHGSDSIETDDVNKWICLKCDLYIFSKNRPLPDHRIWGPPYVRWADCSDIVAQRVHQS